MRIQPGVEGGEEMEDYGEGGDAVRRFVEWLVRWMVRRWLPGWHLHKNPDRSWDAKKWQGEPKVEPPNNP